MTLHWRLAFGIAAHIPGGFNFAFGFSGFVIQFGIGKFNFTILKGTLLLGHVIFSLGRSARPHRGHHDIIELVFHECLSIGPRPAQF
jgi:hypothetical protein